MRLSHESIDQIKAECAIARRERDQQERFKWKANKRADAAEAKVKRLTDELTQISMMAESLCEPSEITAKARDAIAAARSTN